MPASAKVLSPASMAHIVLQTAQMETMADFYTEFLGAEIRYRNHLMTFVSYDEEHHRIALCGFPGMKPKDPSTSGLNHVAFTYASLHDLLLAYRQRKALGITPLWCVNHGPTTSIYYADPDGNKLETQVDNFDNVDEVNAFMETPEFNENFIGVDFDPEEMMAQLDDGVDEKTLKVRKEIGPRGMPPAQIL